MIVEQKIRYEKDGSVGYIESVYDSSNILASIYFPDRELLYISFKRGGVYSYVGVESDIHEDFQLAESQGKYFNVNIKSKQTEHAYRKEFELYAGEIEDKEKIITEWKESQQ